jgi:RNA polymerase sigma-70 factor (ECF subfamily)
VEKFFLQESMQSQIVSMNADDRLERLMQFIEAELPPLSQQIFRLRFIREMSYEEVAQTVGVTKVTVYNHLSQSVQRIKEHFQQQTAKR